MWKRPLRQMLLADNHSFIIEEFIQHFNYDLCVDFIKR